MEKNSVSTERILSRVTAADLNDVVGGLDNNGGTCTITGEPQGNINGSDITNTDCDSD
jgi:hypothetical protein